MKLTKKFAALGAAMLAVCLMFTSCSGQVENTGVAYEKDMKIASAEDLEGKAVAVQLRSEADSFVVDNELTKYVKRYEDMNDAAKDLADKKVAALVVDSNYAKKLVADNDSLKIVKKIVGKVEYKFAALKENGGSKLMSNFNKKIAKLNDSESMNAIIKAELQSGKSYASEKDADKELKKAVTFVADPYFKPFVYKNDKAIDGFFVTVADEVAYAYGAKLTVNAADPDSELSALEGQENAFTVVSGEIDTEKYAVSDTFYTSELVIVVRKDESK